MRGEPPLIAYLRTCSTDPDEVLAATITGKSIRGMGIRPRVLSHGESGIKVYGLTGAQVAKVLSLYDSEKSSWT
jgi:hypothetical protein